MIASRIGPISAVIGALSAAIVLSAGGGCDGPQGHHPAVGRPVGRLPLRSLVDPDRRPPEFRGRVTLLNFWGTWCPPCRRELPGIVRLAARLQGEPAFQFVAVSCGGVPEDLPSLAETTRAFLDAALAPPLRQAIEPWADPDGSTRRIAQSLYGFDAFPTTYLVGSDATIRRVWVGYRSRDEADMAQAVLAALQEPALPVTEPAVTTDRPAAATPGGR